MSEPQPPLDEERTRHVAPPPLADATNYITKPPDADATGYTPDTPPLLHSRDRQLLRRFGDYELLEELGRGGMGVVYKARHLTSDRVVALKMILSGMLASTQAVERFRNEAQAAAKLDHPHIVPVYEIGEVEGQYYFTMQYLAGGSLQERLQQGPLSASEAASVVRRLAEAVQHAHERGIIHRDIKPGNVLLASEVSGGSRPPIAEWSVKLTDFGLARLVEGSGLTATGEQLGTPNYMPPEQAAGRVREVGPVSDVYSLGALLYCLLTGRPPFQAATSLETMRLVLEQ